MPQNKYPVSQLAGTIKQVLNESFKGEYWVFGELNGYKPRPGHAYPSICQRDESGAITAKIDLCIFRNAHTYITGKLSSDPHGFNLEDGLEVCFRLKPDFYPPYGTLRGIVSDIDPLHTMEAAKKRRLEILRRLTDEGIQENNRTLPLPPVITRIGLITARRSAAEKDFMNELERSGYHFAVHTAYATMQGTRTEASVLKSLDKLNDIKESIEVICITRGGGDTTDLQWFDNEAIARWILAHDIPVLTGIGHEIDRCLLDDIARESHKTPTALAGSFVERIGSFLHILRLHAGTLQEHGRSRLAEHSATLDALPRELKTGTTERLRTADTTLLHTSTRIKSTWNARARSHYLALRSTLATVRTAFAGKAGNLKQRLKSSIHDIARARLIPRTQATALRTDSFGLKTGSRKILNNINLEPQFKQIHLKWKLAASRAANRLQHAETVIRHADPQALLKRGYTITTRADGTPLNTPVTPGEALKTRTLSTIITSTVTEEHDA